MNRDLPSSFALNLLLPTLQQHDVRVALTERVGDASSLQHETGERRELRIAEQCLPNNVFFPVVEQASFPDDGVRHLTFAEIEQCRGIPIKSMPNPNGPNELAEIKAFAPDLILTIRYGAILKAPIIAIPRFGVMNLHSGILPSYRGILATFRSLLKGDAEIGCTLHYISDPTIDTGNIIGVQRVAVNRNRSLLGHIFALYPPGVALVASVIEGLMKGIQPKTTAQSLRESAYYSHPTADEWAAFTRCGWRTTNMLDTLDAFARYTNQMA